MREGVAEEKKNKRKAAQQLNLDLPEATYGGVLYEYAVLVTSLKDELRTTAQHYRDRGDSGNNFDELKNQWAWAISLRTTEAMPGDGADHGAHLPLVDDLHAFGNPGQAR